MNYGCAQRHSQNNRARLRKLPHAHSVVSACFSCLYSRNYGGVRSGLPVCAVLFTFAISPLPPLSARQRLGEPFRLSAASRRDRAGGYVPNDHALAARFDAIRVRDVPAVRATHVPACRLATDIRTLRRELSSRIRIRSHTRMAAVHSLVDSIPAPKLFAE